MERLSITVTSINNDSTILGHYTCTIFHEVIDILIDLSKDRKDRFLEFNDVPFYLAFPLSDLVRRRVTIYITGNVDTLSYYRVTTVTKKFLLKVAGRQIRRIDHFWPLICILFWRKLPWKFLKVNPSGLTWMLPNKWYCNCFSRISRTSSSSVNVEPISMVTCEVKASVVGLKIIFFFI